MESNWAAENLQTIRTLMERSAIYRRALAPITIFIGAFGIAAAAAGFALDIRKDRDFAVYWLGVCAFVTAGAFFLVRRQALKSAESFWSPPTRRVVQAMFPALLMGLIFGLIMAGMDWSADRALQWILMQLWALLYGLALQAAGAFMPRGIRLFGWGFLGFSLALLYPVFNAPLDQWFFSPHLLMGVMFGASHLAYGIYLYFTEARKNEA